MKIASRLALSTALAVGGMSGFTFAVAADTPAATTESAPDASVSHGEIKKIIKDAGKITIKHGELKNLEMPPMTMVFHMKDPAMLDQLNVGDKVDFVAEKLGGQFTVTDIKRAQ